VPKIGQGRDGGLFGLHSRFGGVLVAPRIVFHGVPATEGLEKVGHVRNWSCAVRRDRVVDDPSRPEDAPDSGTDGVRVDQPAGQIFFKQVRMDLCPLVKSGLAPTIVYTRSSTIRLMRRGSKRSFTKAADFGQLSAFSSMWRYHGARGSKGVQGICPKSGQFPERRCGSGCHRVDRSTNLPWVCSADLFASLVFVLLFFCSFALLVCCFVALLLCWFVGLLVCWFVGEQEGGKHNQGERYNQGVEGGGGLRTSRGKGRLSRSSRKHAGRRTGRNIKIGVSDIKRPPS